ncbi:MAG TPA: response regulator [Gemmatimonadales bacterium]|nr:response regulator [Gemmatimonadales bacterium]
MAENATRKHPPLVLIANDQEWASRAIETILGPAGYAVLRAYTAQDALSRGRSAQPDVIVLDIRLPGMDGLAVCRTLRSDSRISPSTPIVITTTAPATRSQRLEALRAGANEYFGQPLDGEEFLLRLDSYVRAKFDADRARDEGIIDAATGFYNMRGLARRARELGSAAFRHNGPLGCVVLAPEVEDESHASEETLSAAVEQLAELLRHAGRVSDAIGRLGPTEFAVIAPATDAAGLERLVNRLAERVGPTKIRAGYDAVSDLHAAGLDPVDLLIHATSALRASKADPAGQPIQRFSPSAPSLH